jgi:ectoine hydroxylase-related dioxygenase (phytanoyl-CoA dioxygenase family)
MAPYVQLTAWIALTDANSYNGTMLMVPESHEWGDAYEHVTEIASLAQNNAPIPDSYQGHPVKVVSCDIPKGHVHFHTGLTWHCSGPNWSPDPRCGIALHFVSAGVRFDANHPVAKDYRGVHGEPLDPKDYPLVQVDDAKATNQPAPNPREAASLSHIQ